VQRAPTNTLVWEITIRTTPASFGFLTHDNEPRPRSATVRIVENV